MSKTWRLHCIGVVLHLVASGVLLGGLRVYQQGHNTTHQEQLVMADVKLGRKQTQIKLLEQEYTILHAWTETDFFSEAATCLFVNTDVQPWCILFCEFTDKS